MKKVYIVRDSDNWDSYKAIFTNKKKAEKFVKEHDEVYINPNGVVFHKTSLEEIEVEKFFGKNYF